MDEETPLVAREKKESRLYWWCMMLGLPLALCTAGALFLAWSEQWSFIVSAYVITQMLTTIGYGDFTVKESSSKIFVSIFAVLILTFGAYAVGVLADSVIQKQSDNMRGYLRRFEGGPDSEGSHPYRHLNVLIAAFVPAGFFLLFGTLLFRYLEHCTCGMEPAPTCHDVNFDVCAASGGYVKDTINSFYMSVITLTTIGFGDFQPRTAWGRIISIPWMLLGVAVFGNFIATVSSYFYAERVNDRMLATEAMTDISKKSFDKIDRDGNGVLSPNEFLIYTLLKYEVVSEELVDAILEQYEACDGAKERRVTYEAIAARQRSLLAKQGGQIVLSSMR